MYEKIPLYDGKRKIKVRFFNAQIVVWNCLESVCRAFEQDPKYDVKVVVMCPADHRTKLRNYMEECGHEYIFDEEYDAESDQPDIFIITHAFAKLSDRMKKNIRYLNMVVVASNMLICYDNFDHSIEEFIDSVFKVNYVAFNPDYYIFDRFMYQKFRESTFLGNKLIEMGNAKFDGIYEACMKNDTSKKYVKLSGKKKVLWTLDHGALDGKNPSPNITFDVFIRKVLDYAKENKNIAFIIRPHAMFIVDMLNNGIWKQSDLQILRKFFQESTNMVWDESDTYNEALAVCDAIMVDGFCGIICTALPLGKPVCALYRDEKYKPLHPEITNNYYKASSPKELETFLNMIIDGCDPMKARREAASRKYIKNFDGKNGQRIKDFVEGKFLEAYASAEEEKVMRL